MALPSLPSLPSLPPPPHTQHLSLAVPFRWGRMTTGGTPKMPRKPRSHHNGRSHLALLYEILYLHIEVLLCWGGGACACTNQ